MEPNSTPPVSPSPMPMSESQNGQRKIGPIIATLVIVLILIIAALYVFASRASQPSPAMNTADMTGASQQSVQPITSTSDDVQDIQNDLNSSTNGLDSQNF